MYHYIENIGLIVLAQNKIHTKLSKRMLVEEDFQENIMVVVGNN